MKYASTKEIQAFLMQCRQISTSKDIVPTSFVVIRTAKYKKTMLGLSFTEKQIVEVIEELSLEDYTEGPLEDRDFRGMVWIFGKCIKDKEVYIKLKISELDDLGNKVASLICLSFHFSEKPLKYPYKNVEEK
ncbi:MAG: hypothetical protein C4545_04735 [Anaerolineaceae bacterium]|jgi:hypothetical protein|nr:MAG: hypothetical protein C4545_04735 [Anaerolineaceae bacterium]